MNPDPATPDSDLQADARSQNGTAMIYWHELPRLPGRADHDPVFLDLDLRSRCSVADGVLELYGGLPAKRGVASAGVVECLDVLEDRVGELDAGGPSPPVEELGLHASPERFDEGVVVAVAGFARVACSSTG
jgi:hypothetical protein